MPATISPPVLLDPEQAAEFLTVARQTLAKWRHLGQGPAYLRVGTRNVRYRLEDLDAWLEERAVAPAGTSL